MTEQQFTTFMAGMAKLPPLNPMQSTLNFWREVDRWQAAAGVFV